MERNYRVVDVFSGEPFGGNPAAVVLDTGGLDDARMQAVATEFNLSETTFILPTTTPPPPAESRDPFTGSPVDVREPVAVRFRWFTPTAEVSMCGHATIAGVHAMAASGRAGAGDDDAGMALRIETRSGWLTASVERMPGSGRARLIWLELRPPVFSIDALDRDALAGALRIGSDAWDSSLPPVRTQDHDVLCFVTSVAVLNDIRPDFDRLTGWMAGERLRGVSVATVHTLTPSIHVQSRFFAPTFGVREDPVTGSVHGPLAAYLFQNRRIAVHDGIAGLSCVQGVPGGRAGLVHALVCANDTGATRVRIAGQAVTVMAGTLHA